MKLLDLFKNIKHKKIFGNMNLNILDIQTDSRKIKNGDLFIAHKGHTVDGHDFIDKAIENGAVAVLMEKDIMLPENVTAIIVNDSIHAMSYIACEFFDHPSEKMKIIGVTGTNGKTTTTNIINKILEDQGFKTGIIGTIHIKIDNQYEDSVNTTPSTLDLQRLFNRMLESGVTHVIMEVSSHALYEGRVRGVNFDQAIFTNLSQDHLDYHKTMEEYKHAKGLLFSQLGNSTKSNTYSILNEDDNVSEHYKRITTSEYITYGIDNKSIFKVIEHKITPKGTEIVLDTPNGIIKTNVNLIGKFNIYNILASIVSTFLLDIELDKILRSVSEIKGVEGRFEVVKSSREDITVIVDYAHTPDSLENVLSTIKEFSTSDVITIVGCGGNRDKTKRPIMASISEKFSDLTILTSDNPRFEDPKDILKDMAEGLKTDNNVIIEDRKEAISYAIKNSKKDSIILVAGKGHENYQIIGDKKTHFSDKETVESI